VLLTGNLLPTPIPWLRADALLLCLVWILPFCKPDLEVCRALLSINGRMLTGMQGNAGASAGTAWRVYSTVLPIIAANVI
jgi:hypothetical protein